MGDVLAMTFAVKVSSRHVPAPQLIYSFPGEHSQLGMLNKRKPAPAAPRSQYRTANCREADAIRKQRLMSLEAVQNPLMLFGASASPNVG
jgi:hypothetical protein